MSKWKRLLALLLALVMTLSLTAMPSFADGESDNANVKKTYNIVINYIFENNTIVSDPYTAQLAEGSSFSTTVTFPKVQGYLPYVNDAQQDSMALNYPSISEDVTINVVYKPTNVKYTVIHYQQNVDNDQYTVKETETKEGLTGSTVPDVAKTYEGFTALLYERPTIAADGSTVIEVYYDRNYYLLNLDLQGGWGAEPVYARYGSPVVVSKPERAGYTFNSWTPVIPDTMPAENVTHTAQWESDSTAKVTVVVWEENANDEKYSYSTSYITTGNVGTSFTVTDKMDLPCGQEEHTHTDDCYGCEKEEHTHSAMGGSCYTLNCGNESHTHNTECYEGVGSESWSGSTGKPNNPAEGQVYSGRFGTYIYIKGTWYDYTGSTASGSIAPTTCGKTEHTHTDDCYNLTCDKEAHEHTAACITCGKTEHTHGAACNSNTMTMDSTKWEFRSSDTVTVAADGSTVVNVYYDRVEKTLTFKYSYSRNSYQKTETITAKWGEKIADEYNAIAANAGSTFWSADSNYSGPYTNYFGVMPTESKTYYYQSDNGSTGTMYYYGEDLDGEYQQMFSVSNVGGYTVTVEDHYEFEGFTYDYGTSNGTSCSDAKFYYTRNSYDLVYMDGGEVQRDSVKFEAKLSTAEHKNYTPNYYPAYLEPGAYEFGGWYLDPTGTKEVDWDATMPAQNVTVYAKWVPIEHKVTFAQTEGAEPNTDANANQTVAHGAQAETYATTNGNYTFVGWFYKDEQGVEHAFNFSMAVTRDMDLYAKWSSNVMIPYTVQFVLKDDHSVKVADDLTGSGLAGRTKTFEAKGGTELYAAYQEGYFPTVQSQSLLLDINAEGGMTVIFEYVPMPTVPYTVKYVEKDTGNSLADDKVVSDNRKAVVTETFKPISGYMPDAYQKRLVVTAEGENILYFYYSKDETHAYYKITHYTQNTDGATWTEYASSQAVGDIDTRYTSSPMTIPGFTYDHIKYVVNGVEVTDVTAEGAKLTADGLEINLYYVRNEYPYQVQYLDMAGNQLAEPYNDKAMYGTVLSYTDYLDKRTIADATRDHASPEMLTIQIDEGEGAPNRNIIRIYYETYCYVHHMWFDTENEGQLKEVADMNKLAISKNGTLNFTSLCTDASLYGGTFTDDKCEKETVDDPYNTAATKGTHYYIWEVPNDYLRPKTLTCWHHDDAQGYQLDVIGFYMTTNVDRELYQEVGFVKNKVDCKAQQYTEQYDTFNTVKELTGKESVVFESVTISLKGGSSTTFSAANTISYKRGYLACYSVDENEWYGDTEKSVTYAPYWITLDGVRVDSGVTRTTTYQGLGKDQLAYTEVGTAANPGYSPVIAQDEPQPALLVMANYLADGTPVTSAPVVEDTVTVTVVDGESSYTVQTTDGTVALTPAGMEGKLFAGWYLDDVASDLTGLTEDCTLTAKYVSDSYLGLKYNRSGLLRVTGVTLVSAIDSEDYAETGFLVNGEKVVVDSYSTRYRLIYTAGSLFGSEVASRAPLMSTTVSLSGSGSLTVAPYWVTRDGTTVTGPERSLSYTGWTIRG